MTIDKGIVERLMELREPSTDTLCAHDWVGDDDCVYCRNEELEAEIAKLTDSLSRVNAWLDNCTDRYDKLESDTDAEIDLLKKQIESLAIRLNRMWEAKSEKVQSKRI